MFIRTNVKTNRKYKIWPQFSIFENIINYGDACSSSRFLTVITADGVSSIS